MGIFGKKGDVLDIPDLQRRGLMKKEPEPERLGVKYSGDGFVDLRGVQKVSKEDVSSVESYDSSGISSGGGSSAGTSGGDLLSSIFGGSGSASSGSNENVSESASSASAEGPDVVNPLGFMDGAEKKEESGSGGFGSFWDVDSGSGGSSEGSSVDGSGSFEGRRDSLEIQGLKNKIDDLEYKIDRLVEKVADLEKS